MLIIFGGLPGVGKTTIAKELVKRIQAVYLRIDTVEQALRNTEHGLLGPEGYQISYALAEDNLRLGLSVVADSVNPIELTRTAWRKTAQSIGVEFVEIELLCSDANEHRTRVEHRVSSMTGLTLPTWNDVLIRDYEFWASASLRIDTAQFSVEEAVESILNTVRAGQNSI